MSLKCIKMLTWGQRGSSSQQAPTVTVSEQYLNNIYSISTQYLHSIYTVSTQYLHNICTVSMQYLHNIYSPSTWIWPVELPRNNSGHWSDGGCFGAKYDSHFALLVCRHTSTFVLWVEWNFLYLILLYPHSSAYPYIFIVKIAKVNRIHFTYI